MTVSLSAIGARVLRDQSERAAEGHERRRQKRVILEELAAAEETEEGDEAMGTKTEPGEFDCHGAAAEDEPLFTLRANDEIAPEVVRFWVSRYLETKTADRSISLDDMQRCVDKAQEAARVATAMEAWKAKQMAAKAEEEEPADG